MSASRWSSRLRVPLPLVVLLIGLSSATNYGSFLDDASAFAWRSRNIDYAGLKAILDRFGPRQHHHLVDTIANFYEDDSDTMDYVAMPMTPKAGETIATNDQDDIDHDVLFGLSGHAQKRRQGSAVVEDATTGDETSGRSRRRIGATIVTSNVYTIEDSNGRRQPQLVNFGSFYNEAELAMITQSYIDSGGVLHALMPAHTAQHHLEVEFFDLLQHEVSKCANFYRAQALHFQKQVDLLRQFSVDHALAIINEHRGTVHVPWDWHKTLYDLEVGCYSLWRGATLLKNFHMLNMGAIRKILKKHDKIGAWHDSARMIEPLLQSEMLAGDIKPDSLLRQIEEVFVSEFAPEDRKQGIEFLRSLPNPLQRSVVFMSGLLTTPTLAVIGVAIALRVTQSEMFDIGKSTFADIVPIYLLVLLLSVTVALWGVVIGVARHLLIDLELVTGQHRIILMHANHLLCIAIGMLILVEPLLTATTALTLSDTSISAITWMPGVVLLVIVALWLMPAPFPYARPRWFFVRNCFRVFTAPLKPVVFTDFFLADQFTSMTTLFSWLQYTVCYYVADQSTQCVNKPALTIITLLPFWWRFMQVMSIAQPFSDCVRRYVVTEKAFPHLANAGKYLMALVSGIIFQLYNFNSASDTLWYLALFAFIISTIYGLIWDMIMDWGVVDREMLLNGKIRPRSKTLFSPTVFAVCGTINFILRLTWIPKLIPDMADKYSLSWALLDIVRRGQWNIFRIEHEYMGNCGEFQVINPLPKAFQLVDPEPIQLAEQILHRPPNVNPPAN